MYSSRTYTAFMSKIPTKKANEEKSNMKQPKNHDRREKIPGMSNAVASKQYTTLCFATER